MMSPDQEKKLNELHAAIVGNEELRQKGVIERVENLEKYQEKDKIRRAKTAGGIIVATPFVIGAVEWIKTHFFK